jgi:hypothetical protein
MLLFFVAMVSFALPSTSSRLLLLLLSLSIALYSSQETCDADQTCGVVDASVGTCNLPTPLCQTSSSTSNIYRHGGTAQAYKPDAPVKSQICEWDESMQYKIATWPFHRSSRRAPPPKLDITIRLMSCSTAAVDNGAGEFQCCCQPLRSKSSKATIEVWQTQSDGTYSSLRRGEVGDCRAQAILANNNSGTSSATFQTQAPGSTGILGGLGPSKWDWGPYGPPVLHVLASSPDGHLPTLVDVPIVIEKKTLKQRAIWWNDWRGVGWVKDSPKIPAYEVISWKPDATNNRVSIEIDIFLQAAEGASKTEMCPYYMYGMPSAFFVEPISVCAPSMLDFYAL